MPIPGWRQQVGIGAGIAMIVIGLNGFLGKIDAGPTVFVILIGLATIFTILGVSSWKAIREDRELSS